MRRRVVVPLLAAFLLAALAGPIALLLRTERGQAAFGDSETLGVNRLSSATVEVEIGPSTTVMSASNLAPGDRIAGSIEIVNGGTLPIRYALTSEATTDPLGDWLTWSLWEAPASGDCDGAPAGSETIAAGLTFGADGPDDSAVVGDVSIGLDPGDRLLDPGASETLCVGVELDLDTPDSVQNRRLDQEFTVVAEQHTDGIES